MKTKLISGILTIVILFGLAGCDGNDNPNNSTDPSASSNSGENPADTTPLQPENGYTKEKLLAMPEDDSSNYVYEEVEGGIHIIKYRGSAETIIIPSKIDGKDVVKTGYRSFAFNRAIKAVLIPENMTTISNDAFNGCSELKAVYVVGNKLKTIGEHAFSTCTKLVEIEIPNSVESIDGFTFTGASDVTIITSSGSYAEQFAQDRNIKFKNG